jgi:hypothetical protein
MDFIFSPTIYWLELALVKGLALGMKFVNQNICDLGVDCGGKAVDSVRSTLKFHQNTKRLTLFYGYDWLFWYGIDKKTWDKT